MFMKDILYFLSDMNAFSIALRLLLAMLLGSLVGVERANKRYAAGIRTFALVCMGSALATITGLYLSEISAYPADISRIPAQLLCGIGFLGAGTIIVTDRRQVRGLTTAAGLWVTAAMGIAIGAGFIWAALVCFVLMIITTYFMYYMTRHVENHTRTTEMYIELEQKAVEVLLDFMKSEEYEVNSIERRKEQPLIEGDMVLRIRIDLGKRENHKMIMHDIKAIDGVHYVEELS